MDNIIIEQLACVEINECILQPPFNMISKIEWNDKGLSYDGDIEVYSKSIKKERFVGIVPVQIKGTTTFKKITKRKIKHPIDKKDLEVYYKGGKGVLYFIVTINPKTYFRQAYYSILAPLNLKELLIKLESNGKDSITVAFNKLEKKLLGNICDQFLKIVEKQPKLYIETSLKQEYDEYKIDFIRLQEDPSFNIFEEQAYIYGINAGITFPLKIGRLEEIKRILDLGVKIDNESFDVKFEVKENKYKQTLIIENSIIIEINKETSKAKIILTKIKRLSSHLKCLKILEYVRRYGKFPFGAFEYAATLDENEDFSSLEKDINIYIDILNVFNQIGISEDYLLDNVENIGEFFHVLLSVFKDKQYSLLNGQKDTDISRSLIHIIKLTDNLKVMLLFDKEKNEFIDFFSDQVLDTISGLLPKTEKVLSPDNIEESYWKTSIYTSQSLIKMKECANFKFRVIEKSFMEDYHDFDSPNTINVALEYLNFYDDEKDINYLKIAETLILGYLNYEPNNTNALINNYQIKLRKVGKLSETETERVLDLLENAEKMEDKAVCFACEVLLGNYSKAQRIFKTLRDTDRKEFRCYPIYTLFQNGHLK